MASFYDEIELEDFEFDEEAEVYSYPCPCGDKFLISLVSLSCVISLGLAYIFAHMETGRATKWGRDCPLSKLLPAPASRLRPG